LARSRGRSLARGGNPGGSLRFVCPASLRSNRACRFSHDPLAVSCVCGLSLPGLYPPISCLAAAFVTNLRGAARAHSQREIVLGQRRGLHPERRSSGGWCLECSPRSLSRPFCALPSRSSGLARTRTLALLQSRACLVAGCPFLTLRGSVGTQAREESDERERVLWSRFDEAGVGSG
jgi:hypothetical protein